MGSEIAALVHSSSDLHLAASCNQASRLACAITKGDVIIDFTAPDASVDHARLAAEHGIPIVIGTTGFSEEELQSISDAALEVAVVLSPNMSVGVNVLFAMTKLASAAFDKNFHIEIVETHHAHKKDKPSGTAKKIAQVIQQTHGRDEHIPIQALRTGEVIGNHLLRFTSESESLTLTHHAITRRIFAEGAIRAARWIIGKPEGLYSMQDVLHLK